MKIITKQFKNYKNDVSLAAGLKLFGLGFVIDLDPPTAKHKKTFAIRMDLLLVRFFWSYYHKRRPIGTINLKKGQKIWQYNILTKELKEASFKRGRNNKRGALIMEKNCVYEVAINKKNAVKKMLKRF